MSKPSVPSRLVRSSQQQLDELDSLLQRMLALPVNKLDDVEDLSGAAELGEPPIITNPSVTHDGAIPDDQEAEASEVAHRSSVAVEERVETPDESSGPWGENVSSLPINSDIRQDAASLYTFSENDSHSDDDTVETVPVSEAAKAGPAAAAISSGGQRGAAKDRPVALLPLVIVNRAFDGVISRLGAPGRWFCGTAGRMLLGLLGFALLAGAAAWAILDWTGWRW